MRLVAIALVAASALTLAELGRGQAAYDEAGILYTHKTRGTVSIWKLAADGAGGREIIASASQPTWSTDGTRLAFDQQIAAVQSAVTNIATAEPSGGDMRVLTTSGRVGGPAWSPDDASIAFSQSGKPEADAQHDDRADDPRVGWIAGMPRDACRGEQEQHERISQLLHEHAERRHSLHTQRVRAEDTQALGSVRATQPIPIASDLREDGIHRQRRGAGHIEHLRLVTSDWETARALGGDVARIVRGSLTVVPRYATRPLGSETRPGPACRTLASATRAARGKSSRACSGE